MMTTSDNRNAGINQPGNDDKFGQDLPDSPHDAERMKSEEVTLDLPDVSDIPGQEHIHVMPLGELADTTISSDDEEGLGLFDDEDNKEIVMGTADDISNPEIRSLEQVDEDMQTPDEVSLRSAALDDEDSEGDKLNENSLGDDVSGDDLDVPGSGNDDPDEEIGEEDEENNDYSMGDNK